MFGLLFGKCKFCNQLRERAFIVKTFVVVDVGV